MSNIEIENRTNDKIATTKIAALIADLKSDGHTVAVVAAMLVSAGGVLAVLSGCGNALVTSAMHMMSHAPEYAYAKEISTAYDDEIKIAELYAEAGIPTTKEAQA